MAPAPLMLPLERRAAAAAAAGELCVAPARGDRTTSDAARAAARIRLVLIDLPFVWIAFCQGRVAVV